MEYRIMRAKRLELLQYRSDRIYANRMADLITFGMLVFTGFLIFLRIIGG